MIVSELNFSRNVFRLGSTATQKADKTDIFKNLYSFPLQL